MTIKAAKKGFFIIKETSAQKRAVTKVFTNTAIVSPLCGFRHHKRQAYNLQPTNVTTVNIKVNKNNISNATSLPYIWESLSDVITVNNKVSIRYI